MNILSLLDVYTFWTYIGDKLYFHQKYIAQRSETRTL